MGGGEGGGGEGGAILEGCKEREVSGITKSLHRPTKQ